MKSTQASAQLAARLEDLPAVIAAGRVIAELQAAEALTLESIALMSNPAAPNADGSAQTVQRALAAAAGKQLSNDEANVRERLAQERTRLRIVRAGLQAAAHARLEVVEAASRQHMMLRAPQLRQALLRSIEAFELLIGSVDLYKAIQAEASKLGYWSDSGAGCGWGVYTQFDEDAAFKLAMLKEALRHCDLVIAGLARAQAEEVAVRANVTAAA